ncbi:hypothetical protein GCM10022286_26600 [Gryllotalpicola daejeonensis]|uniref:DUF2975 domain-containing protein n=1 Tax=Gryllotalpicola daejeonensis TaxID=993087 RepID=A0ABP7ZMI5_9MICO
MSLTDEVARPLAKSGALRFVFWISLLYLAICALGLIGNVIDLVDRLTRRTAGIQWTWGVDYSVPQPTGRTFDGAPFIVPGSTATFTQMRATVADLPASVIILHSAGDIVATLTGAGIAVCLVALMNRMAAGVPFARASHLALLWLAGVVFVGFEAVDILHGLASMGIMSILAGAPDSADLTNSNQDVVLFEMWPLYVGAALLALAAVFRVGAVYRQDSEGLV